MLFFMTLIVVAVVLTVMHFYRNFFSLKCGGIYRCHATGPVRIMSKFRQGNFIIFVDDKDVRYFSDGARVGDVHLNSPFRLRERIG